MSFSVDPAWFLQWCFDFLATFGKNNGYSYGQCSSRDDTLASLCSEFLDDLTRQPSEFQSRLGCYNLPQDHEETASIFWCVGWGAPLLLYEYTAAMVYAYKSRIVYEGGLTDDRYSNGFESFVGDMLRGDSVAGQHRDSEPCTLTINFRNAQDFDKLRNSCDGHNSCDIGFNPDRNEDGRDWDDFDREWVPGERCWSGNARNSGCAGPRLGATNSAIGSGEGQHNVTFLPNQLAFYAFVFDWELSLARIALDYGCYTLGTVYTLDDLEAALEVFLQRVQDAQRLAKYALRVVLEWASVLIHEIGHVYQGGGHCEYDCFMVVSATNFVCKVRGHLGLPINASSSYGSDDFDPTDTLTYDSSEYCADGDWTTWTCELGENGEQSGSEFCSSGCVQSDVYAVYVILPQYPTVTMIENECPLWPNG